MSEVNKRILTYALIATVTFVLIYVVYSQTQKRGGAVREVEPVVDEPKSLYPKDNAGSE